MKINSIDIFCEVIDNYGDVGVSYRLARSLGRKYPDSKIRFILNKREELKLIRGNDNLIIKDYNQCQNLIPSDLIVQCFACNIPDIYMEKAYNVSKVMINLEYFSAEDWIEDFHLQECILGRGKLKKYFFMPGLSSKSAGILIDEEFIFRKNNVLNNRKEYLKKFGIDDKYDLIGSIFSYEKNFDTLISELLKLDKKILLLVMSEKTQKNFIKYFDNKYKYDKIDFVKLPFFSYGDYEELLSLCDFNFVRGEDSFVRALLLGKPFLWHIYPQEKNIHMLKLESFLEKYCGKWEELKKSFLKYNLSDDDYEYFFKNLGKIEEHNKEYSRYLLENCNLINKLINFLENLGGK